MTGIAGHLLNVRGALVFVLVGLLVFAEDALFVGFVFPGETAAVVVALIAWRIREHRRSRTTDKDRRYRLRRARPQRRLTRAPGGSASGASNQ